MNITAASAFDTEFPFYEYTKKLNDVFCFIIVNFGILGNILTIILLTVKFSYPILSKNFLKSLTLQKCFSSFEIYILSLSLSDLILLASHLFEDTLPGLSSTNSLFQLVNNNVFFCKIILFVRNASRISSSYLVVLFAWER